MKKVNFISEIIFPTHVHVIAVAAVLASIFFIDNLAASIALIFGSSLVFTGYSGISIDPSSHVYKTYYSFLFIKFGKDKKYATIEKIFLNANQTAQTYNSARSGVSSTYRIRCVY